MHLCIRAERPAYSAEIEFDVPSPSARLPLDLYPFRQLDMNVFRASPFSDLLAAWVLQSFILLCCAVSGFSAVAAGGEAPYGYRLFKDAPSGGLRQEA